jgi:carbonic anhydrase/acetyltransferase-like protein (isoleucine patch superfamily)
MIEAFQGILPQIDPTAWVHSMATLIGKVTVGPESSIWPGSVLRGDDGRIVIGAQTSVQDGSVVHLTENMSETIVGDRVTVGHNVILHGCVVDSDTIIGMGSILLDNAKVGKGSIVGAGTLVPMNKTVPPGVLVLGNPFKVVRELTDKDRQWIEFSWRTYVDKARLHATSRTVTKHR